MKAIVIFFSISFLLLIIGLSVAYVKLADVDALLVVHFDAYRGIDFLGSKQEVFAILFSGVGMNLVNLFLAYALRRREKFLSVLISAFSIMLSSLIFAAVLAIIANN